MKKFEVHSQEELHDKVRQDLFESAEKGEEERLKNEIAKFLLEQTKFDPPQSIVDQETNVIIRDIVQRISTGGATRKHIEERKEDIVNEAERSSRDRVKLSFILSCLADEEKIEVDESEVDDRIDSIAGYYRIPPSRFRTEMEEKGGVERMKRDLRAEKTLNFLLKMAKIKN